MPVTLDRNTTNGRIERYEYKTGPLVEATLHVNNDTNVASLQVRINGAAGAAQVLQVLQVLYNKIKADFNL